MKLRYKISAGCLVAAVCAAPVVAEKIKEGVWVSSGASAYIIEDGSIAAFTCIQDLVTFRYIVPVADLHEAIAGLPQVYLLLAPDPESDGGGRFFYARVSPDKGDDGEDWYFDAYGVPEWARTAMRANRVLNISLTTEEPGDEYFTYENIQVTAAGSAKAIRPVVDACG